MKLKITQIDSDFHARLYSDTGTILDEMSCKLKQDIGWICREMLRWQCKLGSTDPWALQAREKQSQTPSPIGSVKYRVQE
jgi:hypothetical protein